MRDALQGVRPEALAWAVAVVLLLGIVGYLLAATI